MTSISDSPFLVPMPEEWQIQFDRLYGELTTMSLDWQQFLALYAGDQDDLDILNKTGASLWSRLQKLEWFSLAQRLYRFSEHPKEDRTTLFGLKMAIERNHAEYAKLLLALKEPWHKLQPYIKKIRPLRDSIAHLFIKDGYYTYKEEVKPLPKISRKFVDELLDLYIECMVTIQRYFTGQTYSYRRIIEQSPSVTSTLNYLKRGVQADKLEFVLALRSRYQCMTCGEVKSVGEGNWNAERVWHCYNCMKGTN